MDFPIVAYHHGVRREVKDAGEVEAARQVVLFPALHLAKVEKKAEHEVMHVVWRGGFFTIFISRCCGELFYLFELLLSDALDGLFNERIPVQSFVHGHMQYFAYPENSCASDVLSALQPACERYELEFESRCRALLECWRQRQQEESSKTAYLAEKLKSEKAELEQATVDAAAANAAMQHQLDLQRAELQAAAEREAELNAHIFGLNAQAHSRQAEFDQLVVENDAFKQDQERMSQALEQKQGQIAVFESQLAESRFLLSRPDHAAQPAFASGRPTKPHKKRHFGVQTEPNVCDGAVSTLGRDENGGNGQDADTQREQPGSGIEAEVSAHGSQGRYLQGPQRARAQFAAQRRFVFGKETYYIAPRMQRVALASNTAVRQVLTSDGSQSNDLTFLSVGAQVNTVEVRNAPRLRVFGVPEAAQLVSLRLTQCGIVNVSLRGASMLKCLELRETSISGVDLSNLANLERLDVSLTHIYQLDLTCLPRLRELLCSACPLSVVSTVQNTKLEVLEFSKTFISALDVTRNVKLQFLAIEETKIAQLDLTRNQRLQCFLASRTRLNHVDLTANAELQIVDLAYSDLLYIQFAQNAAVTDLDVSGAKMHDFAFLQCLGALKHLKADRIATDAHFSLESNIQLTELSVCAAVLKQLDLSHVPDLYALFTFGTPFSELDISGNKKLEKLQCDQATTLAVSLRTPFYVQHSESGYFKWRIKCLQ